MDEWKAGIDAHDPGRVAAVFTEDAVFQGLRPYGVGRDAVADYYDSQPVGMTVTYRILESRRPADDVVLGYLAATSATRTDPRWSSPSAWCLPASTAHGWWRSTRRLTFPRAERAQRSPAREGSSESNYRPQR